MSVKKIRGETITRDYDFLSIIFLINRLFSYRLLDKDLKLHCVIAVNVHMSKSAHTCMRSMVEFSVGGDFFDMLHSLPFKKQNQMFESSNTSGRRCKAQAGNLVAAR